jgi:CheY-like chemotaxis protein/two-component sensor histidine kinase
MDVTERKQAEAQRTQLEAQLRESQKMEALGTLAGGVAHDFNNALAVILGNVDLARQDVGPAHPALESLEEIGKASRRAKALVQQILAFGRRQTLKRKVISLAPIVQEAAKFLRSTIPAGVGLNVACAPEAPSVLADATQIEQVLINLGSNAWHAIEGQERAGLIEIRLEAELRGGLRFAVLTVRDNGRGMDEATRSHIFEPFFTTKPVDKGTGLGLSVVYGIAQAHEAGIEVESTPGEGTAFVIRFAAAGPPAALVRAKNGYAGDLDAGEPLALQSEGKRVLHVDDEASIVSLATHLLGRRGYRVSGYTDPLEALAAVRADPGQFDLAVTDYNMPGMSGLEVARTLRELRADLPVILISGYITEELQRDALAAGVRELIFKADAVEGLCEAVARYANAQSGDKGIS